MKENHKYGNFQKQIKGITHQFQSTISSYETMDEAKLLYYTFTHNNDYMDANTYFKTMKIL